MAGKIVEVKELEEELAVSEDKYRSLIEGAAEGIATVDLRGRFTFVNKALCRILGYNQEELIGKPFADFLHPEDKKWIVPKFLGAWRYPRRRPHLNFRAVHKKGHFIRMYSSPSLFKRGGMIAGFHAIISDTTDLVEAEQALKESESRLNSVLNSMEDSVFAFDKNGTFTFCHSPGISLDVSPGKLIERSYLEVMPTHISRLFTKAFEKNRNKKTVTFEYWFKVDGEVKCFSAKLSPILTKGDFEGSVAVVRDITDSKSAAQETRRLSQFLNAIIDNIPDPVFIKDRDSRYILANKSYCEFVGKPRDKILGTTDYDSFPREEADFFRQKDMEVIEKGATLEIPEEHVTDASQATHILHTKKAPLKDHEGKITHIVGVTRDITERKRIETQLGESRKFSSTVLNNTPNPLLVADADTAVLYANPALEQLTGYSSSELVGRKAPYPWWPEEQVEKLGKMLKHSIFGELRSLEACFRKKSGESFWVEIKGIPISEEGKLKYYISNWADVTEHKRAKQEIESYASILNGTLESTADGIIVVSRNEKIVAYNRRWVEMLNVPESILRSRDDREIMKFLGTQMKSFETFEKRTRKLFTDPDMESTDVFEYKDGRIFERYSRPHKIGNETAGRVISIRDVTERRRMEDELRRYSARLEELVEERTRELESSKRFLEATMESTPDPIYIKDRDSRYLFANEAYCKLLGKSKDEIIGHTVYDLYPKKQAEILTQQDEKVIWSGTVIHVPDFPVKGLNGKTRIIYTIKAPVKDASGRVAYLVGITRDMTELKQTEEKLRRSEKFRSSMLESSAYPILVVEPDSTIRYVNPALEELTGYSSSQIIGIKSPYPWWPKEDAEKISKNLEEVISQERARYEMRFRRKNGETFWVEVYGVSVEAEGERYYLSHWVDTTERKRLDEIKDRFISTVTHELRTPLVSVKGYIEYILKGKQGTVPEKIESSLAVVKRNTDRLINLTNELLDIRRLQAGGLELSREPLDLREIIDQCAKEIQPLIDSKLQQLQVNIPNKPLHVQADRTRIAQAIMNLLNNASKFTPEGGRVALSTAEDAEVIQVQVSDTGIGIRREDLGRVFEPFTYIRKSIQAEGTGLGLNITKGLVEAHGGRIWVESAGEGEGATFTFTLPKQGRNEVS